MTMRRNGQLRAHGRTGYNQAMSNISPAPKRREGSGAVIGVTMAAWLTPEDMRPERAFQLIDDALAFLEAGLPL
jgi:hypothetical protein